jgi:transcriptional regulator GlxA family with amidase domain
MPQRLVQLLVFPDFQILDATGPLAAFEIASRFSRHNGYRTILASHQGGPIRASCGMSIDTAPLSELVPAEIDTLMAVGGQGVRDPDARAPLSAFARSAAPHVGRIASVCSGSFILAEAGLLDGRRATTHWSRAAEMQRRFPEVRVDADAIFVRDGRIWTSAGITAGIDLALAMIEEDLGEDIARRTAQMLVVYHRRPAGQSQFSALLELGPARSRFSRLNGWVRENLSSRLSIEDLAARAGMSERNFARAYAKETGLTPAKAVERFRVEAARSLLQATGASVDQVAAQTGFGDSERMRRAFLRAFGQPPQALRRIRTAGGVAATARGLGPRTSPSP